MLRHGNLGDGLFWGITALFALTVMGLIGFMALQMCSASLPTIKRFGWGFIFGSVWSPPREIFGALPFIYGTVVSSLVALAISVPISLGVAIYLAKLAPPWLRSPVGFLVELLAAVPSVVYGLWGIFVLAPFMREWAQPALAKTLGFLPLFQGPALGYGLLSAGLVLAVMITPTIASVSREVIRAVPPPLEEAALGLGATRWEALRHAVLPYARSGLVGAIILGLGRALGETMAVTMLIGNRAEISASLFSPAYTMASVVANEFAEANDDIYLSALAEIGLLLFVVTVLLNIVARLLVWKVARGPKGAQ